jgi:hypothetical protein
MVKACRTHGEMRSGYNNVSETLKQRDQLGNPGVDGRRILK